MVRLGAHVSITGGVFNAPMDARQKIGAETFQIFAKNQRQWKAKPYSKDDLARWHDGLRTHGYRGSDVIVHASYLINAAADGAGPLANARAALADELERADQLGVLGVCFHPGSHTGRGVDVGIKLARGSMAWVLERVRGDALLLPEIMAGHGAVLGSSPREMADLVAGFDEDRVAVTLDTCHLFASGLDLRGQAWGASMETLDDAFGLHRVKAWHLNDSVLGLGERKDRHERIGDGRLGKAGFVGLLKDARFRHTVATLETDPLDDALTGYKKDLRRLRAWAK